MGEGFDMMTPHPLFTLDPLINIYKFTPYDHVEIIYIY